MAQSKFGEHSYKRPLDLTILTIAHIILLPVWVFLWVVIPLAIFIDDRGPIFYRQKRIGRGGAVFSALKFRSMIKDAEKSTGPMWATPGDKRVTRVGRVLRRTALDELPQVINIWRGDMSLVGPRSERPELHLKFAREYAGFDDRLQVRPGLTGLAQINGAYNLPPDKKLVHDLEYIQQHSLLLDVDIIAKSVVRTLAGKWDVRTGGHTEK